MKKSIKYAGIAAATLLAVAPVAAPVVSQAADSDDSTVVTTPDYNKQQDSADAFKSSLYTETPASTLYGENAAKTSVQQGKMSIATFNTEEAGLVKAAIGQTDIDNIGKSAYVTVSAKTTKGAAITTDYDLNKILTDTTQPEVEFTVTLNFTNTNGVADSRTATVKATKSSTSAVDMTSAKATFTTPLSVALNTTVTSSTLDASNDAKIVDQNGNSVLTAGSTVKAGNGFFNTYTQAIEAAKAGSEDTNQAASVKPDTTVEPNGTSVFTKAGTYYQVVTFTGATGTALDQFIKNYNLDPSTYSVYVNGALASAGYDFVSGTTAAGNTTLKFVRAINVSNTTDQWTVSDTTGVVTTKSDHSVYTLKDGDNNTIVNRGLAANTAWKTDKVRVNQDGVKQYRVATNEWINADDVNYGETVTSNGLTDIKAASGVATLTKPAGYVMSLFGDDGNVLDRGLASGTAWRVDKTAKDAAGNTYYRVATGEWLQAGEGVSFK
ncbi:hypothetical protein [Companilactobacillus sp. HBUAS59544]|uniref:hypothetical protein n=1 Tax=Companilactobacillus sp. HBUAS59544 TaxID=3109363 RepID=UPI002FF3767D